MKKENLVEVKPEEAIVVSLDRRMRVNPQKLEQYILQNALDTKSLSVEVGLDGWMRIKTKGKDKKYSIASLESFQNVLSLTRESYLRARFEEDDYTITQEKNELFFSCDCSDDLLFSEETAEELNRLHKEKQLGLSSLYYIGQTLFIDLDNLNDYLEYALELSVYATLEDNTIELILEDADMEEEFDPSSKATKAMKDLLDFIGVSNSKYSINSTLPSPRLLRGETPLLRISLKNMSVKLTSMSNDNPHKIKKEKEKLFYNFKDTVSFKTELIEKFMNKYFMHGSHKVSVKDYSYLEIEIPTPTKTHSDYLRFARHEIVYPIIENEFYTMPYQETGDDSFISDMVSIETRGRKTYLIIKFEETGREFISEECKCERSDFKVPYDENGEYECEECGDVWILDECMHCMKKEECNCEM